MQIIHTNKAKCRVCMTLLDATEADPKHQLVCDCGFLVIGGGTKKLKRSVRSWSVLEELSEVEEVPDAVQSS